MVRGQAWAVANEAFGEGIGTELGSGWLGAMGVDEGANRSVGVGAMADGTGEPQPATASATRTTVMRINRRGVCPCIGAGYTPISLVGGL